MADKKKKKWKKRIGKALLAGAALAGGLALAKRRKTKALNAITDYDVSGGEPLSGKIGYEGDFPSVGTVGTVYPGSNKAWKIKNSLAHKNWNKLDESEVDWNYNAPSTEIS